MMNVIKYDIIFYDITVKNEKMIINLYQNFLILTFLNILYAIDNKL